MCKVLIINFVIPTNTGPFLYPSSSLQTQFALEMWDNLIQHTDFNLMCHLKARARTYSRPKSAIEHLGLRSLRS